MGLEVPSEIKQLTANLIKKRTYRVARQATEKYHKGRCISKNSKFKKYNETEFQYKPKEKVSDSHQFLNVHRSLTCPHILATDAISNIKPKPKVGMKSTLHLVLFPKKLQLKVHNVLIF